MTTMQLNAQIYSCLAELTEDEGMMKRAATYLNKLVEKLRAERPNATTLAAIAEAKEGKRVSEEIYDNVDDLMKNLMEA